MTSLADRVNRFIVEGAKTLRLDSAPIEGMGEQTLTDCYAAFIKNADRYSQFSQSERPVVARTNREAFNTTDFQAMHYVLRQNFPIDVINKLTKQECREVALDLLYGDPERYRFFSTREAALKRFHELDIIQDLSDYCRKYEQKAGNIRN